jgi:hypothetical protein
MKTSQSNSPKNNKSQAETKKKSKENLNLNLDEFSGGEKEQSNKSKTYVNKSIQTYIYQAND